MTPITVFLHAPDTVRVDFPYDALTVAAIKRLDGATWNKAGKFWALPVQRLDKLIKTFGDDLEADAEVWLAASPKTPAMIRAENDAWASRQGMGLQTQGDPATRHGEAMVDAGEATKFDKMLHENLGTWVAQAEKEKAIRGKGKRWRGGAT